MTNIFDLFPRKNNNDQTGEIINAARSKNNKLFFVKSIVRISPELIESCLIRDASKYSEQERKEIKPHLATPYWRVVQIRHNKITDKSNCTIKYAGPKESLMNVEYLCSADSVVTVSEKNIPRDIRDISD